MTFRSPWYWHSLLYIALQSALLQERRSTLWSSTLGYTLPDLPRLLLCGVNILQTPALDFVYSTRLTVQVSKMYGMSVPYYKFVKYLTTL